MIKRPAKFVPRGAKDANHKIGDYQLMSKFPGYRAREDKTTLNPATLVAPSHNVVLNTAGRVALVKGYALDGDASSVADSGILSPYDFTNFKGDVRNLRAGFMTEALNDGKLQYRYNNAGTVQWVDLATGLTNIHLSYTSFNDQVNPTQLLWVDGSNNIFSWNGAVTTLLSATATTITKSDPTKTWEEEGFIPTSGSIVIGGVTATYSGGSNSQTLTGVSVDFSASPALSVIHQAVVTNALSGMTPPTGYALFATFAPTLIGCGQRQQVYLANATSGLVIISKVLSFTDYSQNSTSVRVSGDGAIRVVNGIPKKFIAQESNTSTDTYDLYVSYGKDNWAVVRISTTLTYDSSGVAKGSSEELKIINLKLRQ